MIVQFIRAGSDIFELRPHRRAILWRQGRQCDHDFPKDEIRSYADHGDWQYIDEETARELIAQGSAGCQTKNP
jgi:hypothetical protein